MTAASADSAVPPARNAAAPAPAPKRRRKALPTSLRVLSIDVGLRNLGLALVRLADGEELARLAREDCVTPLGVVSRSVAPAPTGPLPDPTDVLDLLMGRIVVEHAENVDVLEENGCTAKNAKAIGPLRQVSFWHGCMMKRSAMLLDPPPDLVVVEVQDGGNATMRQMSTGIVGLFMGHFEARHRDGHLPRVPAFTMIRGDMKMKICERIQTGWGGVAAAGAAGAAVKAAHAVVACEAPSSDEEEDAVVIMEGAQEEPAATSAAAAPAAPAAKAAPAAPAAPSAPAAESGPPAPPPEPPAYLLKVNPRRYYALQRAREKEIAARAKLAELGLDAAPAVPPGEDEELLNPAAKKRASSGRNKAAYELRKKLAVASFELYMDRVLSSSPHLLNRELRLGWRKYTQKKRRDVSDAVLQGVYVIARELKLV